MRCFLLSPFFCTLARLESFRVYTDRGVDVVISRGSTSQRGEISFGIGTFKSAVRDRTTGLRGWQLQRTQRMGFSSQTRTQASLEKMNFYPFRLFGRSRVPEPDFYRAGFKIPWIYSNCFELLVEESNS